MPNPFPGMNAYLEQSYLWADIHATLRVALRAQLTPHLPPGFRARIEQYLRIEEPVERIRLPLTYAYPDLYVDLQAAINRVFDEGGFETSLEYQSDPYPPLPSGDIAWVDQLLRDAHLR